jgi:hypothetical protein
MKKLSDHPMSAYFETLIETFSLLTIIDDIERHKVKNLNKKKNAIYKASIIHICASLESFLEDCVNHSIENMNKYAVKSNQIPINILLSISARLKENKDERAIWKISDDNWKMELIKNTETLTEKFNTPRPAKIDEYIFKTIGLKDLSHHWFWKGQSYQQSIKKLNKFMDIRGDLTHRYKSDHKVNLNSLVEYGNFIYRISCISSNVLREHTKNITMKDCWTEVKYKKLWAAD